MAFRRLFRSEGLWLGVILMAALSLRLYFFVGASAEDDLGFLGRAFMLSKGHWEYGLDLPLRRMNYLPIGMLYRLWGIHDFTTHLYHMGCALLTIATAFGIARALFDFRTAMASALFLSWVPLHILYSSRVMPSIPETMWGGLGLWLLCWAETRHQKCLSVRAQMFYLGAGALIGVAYLVRETAIVLMAVPVAYLALEFVLEGRRRRERGRQCAMVILGFLLIWAGETAFNYHATHEWLHRWRVVHEAQMIQGYTWPGWTYYLTLLLNFPANGFSLPWRLAFRESLNPQNHYWASMLGLMGYAIVLGVIGYALTLARGPKKIVLLWFFAYFLFLSFGAVQLHPYVTIRKFPRYQLLYLTPASIMVGGCLASMWAMKRGRLLALAIGVTLAATSLFYTRQGYSFGRSYYRGVQEIRRMLSQSVDPNIPMYIDDFQSSVIALWSGYRPSIYQLRSLSDLSAFPSEGCYFLVEKDTQTDAIVAEPPTKPFLSHLPARAIKVAEVKLGEFEYFKPGRYPSIYYLPPENKAVR